MMMMTLFVLWNHRSLTFVVVVVVVVVLEEEEYNDEEVVDDVDNNNILLVDDFVVDHNSVLVLTVNDRTNSFFKTATRMMRQNTCSLIDHSEER